MSLVTIFACSIDVWTLHVTVWLSWTIGNTLHSVKFTKQSCIDVRRVPPLPVLLPLSVSPHTDATPDGSLYSDLLLVRISQFVIGHSNRTRF